MNPSQNLAPSQRSPDHPSQSIPNAAYPDAPYQPGSGFQGHASTAASTSLTTSVTGNNTISYSASPSPAASPNQSAANTAPLSWPQAAPPSTSIPDCPPPPYVRDEHSSPYIPAHTRPPSHWTGTRSNQRNEQPDSVPWQSLSPAASAQGSRAPATSITQHDQLPSAYYTAGSGSIAASTQTGKLGPVAEARRRRRRHVKICIVLLTLAVLFVLALVIGIALGLLKNTARNNGD